MQNNISAAIFGCAGKELTEEEKVFFKKLNPVGFIIFSRNIDNPDQVRKLCASLRACTDRDDTPILIDQEGGRVARLQPPHWPVFPPAKKFGDEYCENCGCARQDCFDNFKKIGEELAKIGVNVDCAPILDVPVVGANEKIIGDRPFSKDVDVIIDLGKKACEALLEAGVLPIVKHIPGHGRAKTDSHFELPIVDTKYEELKNTDFKTFKGLADAPWAMTAHVLYTDIDASLPGSLSKKVINDIIRKEIGFDGFLICDDLSMKALNGDFENLTRDVLAAGCDAVLHCNGDMEEMKRIASALPKLSPKAYERYIRAQNLLKK